MTTLRKIILDGPGIVVCVILPPFIMIMAGMTNRLSGACLTARTVMFAARLDMYRDVCADDMFADLSFDVVGDIMRFFNGEVFAHGQVKINHLL